MWFLDCQGMGSTESWRRSESAPTKFGLFKSATKKQRLLWLVLTQNTQAGLVFALQLRVLEGCIYSTGFTMRNSMGSLSWRLPDCSNSVAMRRKIRRRTEARENTIASNTSQTIPPGKTRDVPRKSIAIASTQA